MLINIIFILLVFSSVIWTMGPPFTPPGHSRGRGRGHGNGRGQGQGNGRGKGNRGGNKGKGNAGKNNAGGGMWEEPPFPDHLTTPKTTNVRNKRSIEIVEYLDTHTYFSNKNRQKRSVPSDTTSESGIRYYKHWNPSEINSQSIDLSKHLWPCIMNKHECVPQSECKLPRKHNRRFCHWDTNEPYVCCKTLKNNKSKELKNKCGKVKQNHHSEAIVGGVPIYSGTQYPWMVAIGEKLPNNSISWFCGGALVGEKTVVTAAHCISQRKANVARMGVADLSETSNKVPYVQEIKVHKTLIHSLYRPPALYNDVALLFLETPVQFTSSVQPVCVSHKTTLNYNSVALVSGWGQLNFAGDRSAILQAVTLQIFNNSYCNMQYSLVPASRRSLPKGILDTQMCAGDVHGGKDACQSDSGAPLVIEENGSFYLTGVVSAGYGCGSKMFPGVYSKVASFASWILKNNV